MLVEFGLRDLGLVGGCLDPVKGRADLGLAALVKPEKKAPLPFRGDKVLVDVQGVGREFVGVLPRNPPAPEMLPWPK